MDRVNKDIEFVKKELMSKGGNWSLSAKKFSAQIAMFYHVFEFLSCSEGMLLSFK